MISKKNKNMEIKFIKKIKTKKYYLFQKAGQI